MYNVNLTRHNSRASADIKVPLSVSFSKIREIMEQELPRIGQANDQIINGPFYNGITSSDSLSAIITVSAECKEQHKSSVTNYLREATIELLYKESSDIWKQ